MASSKSYLGFILDQLSGLEEISHRAMMGEYVLYYRGRVIGGIYDDRLMVKNVPAAMEYDPSFTLEAPYAGAKPMILIENVDSREYLEGLFQAMYEELPEAKTRKKH